MSFLYVILKELKYLGEMRLLKQLKLFVLWMYCAWVIKMMDQRGDE